MITQRPIPNERGFAARRRARTLSCNGSCFDTSARSRLIFCALAGALATTLVTGVLHPKQAAAQIAMSGRFVAEARCPALQSIKQKSNPGTVSTDPGRSYTLIGRNTDQATHYYLEFPGAEPERRWVAIGCGRIETGAVTAQNSQKPSAANSAAPRKRSQASRTAGRQSARADGRGALADALSTGTMSIGGANAKPESRTGATTRRRPSTVPVGQYILAASWHPAFCEGRPNSRDCRTAWRASRTDGFALHGLWPQPRNNEYCGVSAALVAADRNGPWRRLPKPRLHVDTRRDLERVMPGIQSDLERHQWLRHGTCYGAEADRYFSDAVALIDALNRSTVADLFTRSVGSRLTADTIRSAFDDAFGGGAGRKVEIECADDDGRRIVTELHIALARSAVSGTDLSGMITAGLPRSRGCAGGVVDPIGDQ